MAKCDLCGNSCAAAKMTTLREQYSVDSVDDVCESCAEWVNAVKNDALAAVAETVKAAIRERIVTPVSRPWWRFWL